MHTCTGRTVYEWEQSLEEVNLYIETPPGVKADLVDCKITPRHLRLGIKGNPPFLDVRRLSLTIDGIRCANTCDTVSKSSFAPPRLHKFRDDDAPKTFRYGR